MKLGCQRPNCTAGALIWLCLIATGSTLIATRWHEVLAETQPPAGKTTAERSRSEKDGLRVVSKARRDVNEDGITDYAGIVISRDRPNLFTLLINVSNASRGRDFISWNNVQKEIAWAGTGTEPSVSIEASTFMFFFEKGRGRDRRELSLYVRYLGGRFVVDEFGSTKLLEGGREGEWCSVRFATGKGIKCLPGQSCKEFQIPARLVELSTWSDDTAPESCR